MHEVQGFSGSIVQPMKRIISRVELTKAVNGYTVNGYNLSTNVFINLEDALEFIKNNIGKEVE